jgi:formate--tetrahydrofolate ligase
MTSNLIEKALGLSPADYDIYGAFAVKLKESWLTAHSSMPSHKPTLVLVTGITPTPTGEGKTTTAIALTDALQKFRSASVCLRQASLGPYFGVKGGASGGGLADLAFPQKTNLHFTGDFHAIASAHNLIAALIDNHLHHGNQLRLDSKQIFWKRSIDMNDRTLRSIQIGLGKGNGVERSDGFNIVAASEVMAALCLAQNPNDLQAKLQKIALGLNEAGRIVRLGELGADESLHELLEDSIRPNITLTRGGSPCFIHGGPFANIAHGCNSIRATRAALNLSEIVVTEAGFGSDLGAEKFLNIKAPNLGTRPDVAVLVASLRALKFHGGQAKEELHLPSLTALKNGIKNLDHHINLIQKVYGLPCVVALNIFVSDTQPEFDFIEEHLAGKKVAVSKCYGFTKGASGAVDLAQKVLATADSATHKSASPIYDLQSSLKGKIESLAQKVHGASAVEFSEAALADLSRLEPLTAGLPICLAKTPFSLTADPKKGGLPQSHTMPVSRILPSFGAGFVVVTTGDIMLMPGLPKTPRGTSPVGSPRN